MIDTKVFSSEALPDYYNRLAQRLEDCSCFRIALAKKAEAGSTRSEKGYQMLAVSTARGIAEALSYDANKAASRQAGVPTLGATLLEMTKELPEIPPRMTAEERAEILAGVDEFVRYYAFPEGLYRYVRSDGGDTKGEPQ